MTAVCVIYLPTLMKCFNVSRRLLQNNYGGVFRVFDTAVWAKFRADILMVNNTAGIAGGAVYTDSTVSAMLFSPMRWHLATE